MSYQKVYRALNGGLKKKASKEQLTKLASLIRMRKKAQNTSLGNKLDNELETAAAEASNIKTLTPIKRKAVTPTRPVPDNPDGSFHNEERFFQRIKDPSTMSPAERRKYLDYQRSLRPKPTSTQNSIPWWQNISWQNTKRLFH